MNKVEQYSKNLGSKLRQLNLGGNSEEDNWGALK
jgi:hypothetical protein